MKIQIFSVFDSKTGIYSQPTLLATVAVAKRMWPEAAQDKTTQIGQYPADFTLFHLGQFDDETGKYENLMTPVSLGTALEARQQLTRNEGNENAI